METTLTAMSAAACLAHPFTPPITGAEGTVLSAYRLVTGSFTDATQVPPRGRPV